MRNIYGGEIENVGKRDPLNLTHFYKSGDNTRSYNNRIRWSLIRVFIFPKKLRVVR